MTHDTEVGGGTAVRRFGTDPATWARILAGVLAVAVMSTFVLTGSRAAFTETTENTPNTWNTGGISLTDDDLDVAMFDVNDIGPDQSDVRCIAVTYDGDLAADVKLYGSIAGDLAPFLRIQVEVGTGGGFGDCSGFSADSTLVATTPLDTFGTTHSSWANGAAAFSAGAEVTTRTFRFTVSLPSDNDAQNKSATATFTWEAQTT